MAAAGDDLDIAAVVRETIEFLAVRPEDDGWVGDAPEWFGERLFGGFVLGQSEHARGSAHPLTPRVLPAPGLRGPPTEVPRRAAARGTHTDDASPRGDPGW